MAVEFQMPKLGLTMEEGTIVGWYAADGDRVEQGAAVLEIETDKVTSDVEASATGALHITGVVGETYACGEPIGWILEPGETPPEPVPGTRPAGPATATGMPAAARSVPVARARTQDGRLLASPNARRVAAERGIDLTAVAGSGPGGRIVSEDVPTSAAPATAGHRVEATMAARQLATQLGVDLRAVVSTGPEGRIDRADVARHVRERLAGPAKTDTPLPSALQTPSETIPLTGMRGTIAHRMHASLQQMAQLTLTMDVTMDAVVRDRADRPAPKPGYTDYVVAAVAAALVDHPVVNSQITADGVALLPEVNVGLAVAVDGGLVVPVVRGADTLSIEALSGETSRLATAARDGELTPADLEGGTFSVTALGMYGVDAFTPVVNPPNTAVLGVGRLRDGVEWTDSGPTRVTLLTLSLTWDHRAFDGAPAADFTAAVRDRLQAWGAS